MTNIVLCFGEDRPSNVTALLTVLDQTQTVWHHEVPRRRRAASDAARTAITAGYRHLMQQWEPGDQIYVFGAGHGAACAQALSRLLGTIGVLDGELIDYMLATYAVPRTPRTGADWRSIAAVAAGLTAQPDIAVPVRFLGLWDTTRVRGTAGPVDVIEGRHAIAIDGGPLLQRVDGVDEVWFRGTHRGVLSDTVTLDWMLDGATRAGLSIGTVPVARPVVERLDTRARGLRRMPDTAAVHASVEQYVRAHPAYWRRLPAEVVWADTEWLARTERLVPSGPRQPITATTLAAAS